MLTSIQVENFRGIRSGTLDQLTPLTLLVGPNGSGKTTMLEAMAISTSPVRTVAQFPWQKSRWLLPQGDTSFQVSLSAGIGDVSSVCTMKVKTTDGNVSIHFTRAINDGDQQWCALNWGADGWQLIPVTNDKLMAPALPDVRLVTTAQATPLHQLFTTAVGRGQRNALRLLIRDALPPADDLEILTEGDEPVLHVVYPDYSVPLYLAGDGIHRLVRLVLEMAAPPGSLVLLEEPEIHQYPRSIRLTAQAIWAAVRRGIQVVLTTHSLELIDALVDGAQELDQLSLYRVLLQQGTFVHSRLSGELIAASRGEIEDDLR